jgi:hypothetical protein
MKLAPHTPIRPKYSPTPTEGEKRFHLWLMDMPCVCCGSEQNVIFHHLLSETHLKRWRRDHEMGFQLADACHVSLHCDGDEWAWCMARGFDPIGAASDNREWGRMKGLI